MGVMGLTARAKAAFAQTTEPQPVGCGPVFGAFDQGSADGLGGCVLGCQLVLGGQLVTVQPGDL
ncbi:MAG TPA: hypothetical protein VMB79_04025, partial [Jatrophihabitans sp.]|nr:hypothetical protein [Jatrophihabitans sp.]